jgi:N-acetylglucosaminyldiphosphoundecaprenol N-acetyl-beta-D-mannosaminyltransferase
LGAADGVAEKTKEKLEIMKHITIVGTYAGTPDPKNDSMLQNIINDAKPDLLFVAYGAPKQELWLERNLPHLRTIKVAMGVGGAFDFITGIRKRAPLWMRKIGLEWLFRVIQQPSRLKRIINATIIFPLIFLTTKER